MKALYQKIRQLNGKNYGLYKTLGSKTWNFGDFSLEFIHIQSDPYAPPSRVLIKAKLSALGYKTEWGNSFERRLALSDFLCRKLSTLIQEKYPDSKEGALAFPTIGPEMLVRNSLWIDNGELRVCMQVKLPGDGRKIQSELAAEILTMVLPDIICASIFYNEQDEQKLQKHFNVLDVRKKIMRELDALDLVAFIPNGAILPRASGLSYEPLQGAIPFEAPKELTVSIKIENQEFVGMGIPKGITVITGGAFHGKSTVLQALTQGVFPHVPGDGREGIVVDESALRVGVEEGRSIRNTDISPFVKNLPGGVSTKNFTTLSASGSTSQAANLLEAFEAGAKTFFIDEDSSAVNFLIRDTRVRELLGDEQEPLIPLTDKITHICYDQENANPHKAKFSFVLVAGACGSYLDIADNIIVMSNYKATCPKKNGQWFKENFKNTSSITLNTEPFKIQNRDFKNYMEPLQKYVRPSSAVERQVKVKLLGDTLLQIGFLVADTSKLVTLLDKQQRLGAGYILLNMLQNASSFSIESQEGSSSILKNSHSKNCNSIKEFVQKIHDNITNVGFRNLPQGLNRDISLPRTVDIALVAFRLGTPIGI